MNYDDMITGRYYLNGDVGVTLEQRITKAARSYYETAGSYPNLAHVNPKIINQPCTVMVDGHKIKVVPDRMMSTFVAWVGIGRDSHDQ